MASPNDVDPAQIRRVTIVNPASGSVPLVPGIGAGTSVTASATAVAGASSSTLPGVAGKTTYITGFTVTGGGATGASIIAVTLVGVITGTQTYYMGIPAGATAGVTALNVTFSNPVPASATNTAIVVTVPSFGAGSTNQASTATGFQL